MRYPPADFGLPGAFGACGGAGRGGKKGKNIIP